MTIRVALVDDQALLRSGVAMVLSVEPDIEVTVEAGDGEQAARELRSTAVDVVLMDIRMPGVDGIEATRRLLAASTAHPVPRVIMLTTFGEEANLLAALRAGASGFLTKDTHPRALVEAVRAVASGDAVISPASTRRLLDRLIPGPSSPPSSTPDVQRKRDLVARLTNREAEVLKLIALGRSNAELAEELFISPATVKTHVGAVLAKLEARDRIHAVITAYDIGLVSPPE